MPEVRHGLDAGRHTVRPLPTYDRPPFAPCYHGSADGGGDDGGDDDDDALILACSNLPPAELRTSCAMPFGTKAQPPPTTEFNENKVLGSLGS
jgi:hypothetical protein